MPPKMKISPHPKIEPGLTLMSGEDTKTNNLIFGATYIFTSCNWCLM
jgi:hypothetical protein